MTACAPVCITNCMLYLTVHMRKIQRKAAAKQSSSLLFNTQSGLPKGMGALSFRCGSYWMVFRNAAGERTQENTHTKNRIVARVMLAERVLERITAEQKLLTEVIREGQAALTADGWHRLSDGGWIGSNIFTPARDAGRARRVGQRSKASSRTRTEVGR